MWAVLGYKDCCNEGPQPGLNTRNVLSHSSQDVMEDQGFSSEGSKDTLFDPVPQLLGVCWPSLVFLVEASPWFLPSFSLGVLPVCICQCPNFFFL